MGKRVEGQLAGAFLENHSEEVLHFKVETVRLITGR